MTASEKKSGARAPKPSRSKGRRRRARRLSAWAVIHRGAEWALWGLIIAAAVIVYATRDMPALETVWSPSRPAVTLLDRTGARITDRGLSYRGEVTLDELPAHLPLAVLAAEDRRFFEHGGIDLRALGRALVANIRAGRVVQGGSTITQQLVKNLFLTPDRTIRRKVQEAVLSLYVEARLSKEEILTLYLNRVYFGAGAHGIDAAARRYFGKPASDVGLREAALLAGLLKAPSRFAPTANRTGAYERADLVLRAMVDAGFINPAQRMAAAGEPVGFAAPSTSGLHYFTDWVLRRLPAYIGAWDEPILVRTTLDLAQQQAAEAAVRTGLDGVPGLGKAQSALIALAPDGSIRAMIGGRSYRHSQYNRAVLARRQPGSAFKPFVYLAALENGYRPSDTILDAPITVDGWSPENFTGRYAGEVKLTTALAASLNTATVRLSEAVGRQRVIRTARRLGLKDAGPPVGSLALGTMEVSPIDLAAAFAPFANGGYAVAANPILRIETASGLVLYEREDPNLGRVMDPSAARAMDSMLRAAVSWGTGRQAAIPGRTVGGKTGTTQDYRDAWFVGYTPGLVAAVWVGHDDNAPLDEVTGGTVPARIWQRFASTSASRIDPVPALDARIALAGRNPPRETARRSIGGLLDDLLSPDD